jgi:hypothetical protein
MTTTELLTEAEAAAYLRIGARTLRELRRQRKIHYVALTERKIAYRLEDCEEYIASRLRLDSGPACAVSAGPGTAGKGKRGKPRAGASVRHGNVVPFSQRKRA